MGTFKKTIAAVFIGLVTASPAYALDLSKKSPDLDFIMAYLSGQALFYAQVCPNFSDKFKEETVSLGAYVYFPPKRIAAMRTINIKSTALMAYESLSMQAPYMTKENIDAFCQKWENTNTLKSLNY